jgi:hypothetical protein
MTKRLALGKASARLGAIKLRMSNYVDTKAIAKKIGVTSHSRVGHKDLVKDWGMLGNDQVGDCVIAGIYHNIMLWNAMQGKKLNVSTQRCLQTYTELTGYDPAQTDSRGNNPTDNGTDMAEAALHLRNNGFADDDGGDFLQHVVAIKLFAAIGIGIKFPMSAWAQFEKHQTWKPVKGTRFDGGHYISGVAKSTNLDTITWGRVQPLNAAFLSEYEDEANAYLSWEMLNPEGKGIDGFDKQSLLDDLALFTGQSTDQVIAQAEQANTGAPATALA